MKQGEYGYLALSGIQHFAYCPRQWALIHLDQQWAENALTELGSVMHDRAHDETLREKRGDTITIRDLSVRSSKLGLYGKCDVVEFRLSDNGVPLYGESGCWLPVPVEYKRGRMKTHDADRMQLCAQAICLEEMLSCDIDCGFLYYGTTRSRERVTLTTELRNSTLSTAAEMHRLFERRHIPAPPKKTSCKACSLLDICLPKLQDKLSASDYLTKSLTEDDHEAFAE